MPATKTIKQQESRRRFPSEKRLFPAREKYSPRPGTPRETESDSGTALAAVMPPRELSENRANAFVAGGSYRSLHKFGLHWIAIERVFVSQ